VEIVAVSVTFAPVSAVLFEAASVVVVEVKLDEVTVTVTALDVLVRYVDEPAYVAVMVCVPAVLNDVDNAAVPELSATLPSAVVPS